MAIPGFFMNGRQPTTSPKFLKKNEMEKKLLQKRRGHPLESTFEGAIFLKYLYDDTMFLI